MPEQPTNNLIQAMAQRIAEAYQPPVGAGRASDIADAGKLQVFLTALSEGCYRNTACSLADMAPQTFHNWVQRGRDGEKCAKLFIDAVEKCEAWAERELVADVRRAGKKEQFWAASMTMLERKYPDKYGRRNEDTSVAKVIVQIGARDSDVTVITQTQPVNVIDNYQTQTEGVALTGQSLAGGLEQGFARESERRKLLGGAKGQTDGSGDG